MSRNWYEQSGAEGDVVISTRIRLARNIQKYPFPAAMTDQQRAEVTDTIRKAAEATGEKLAFLDMGGMTDYDALSLAEKHLISPEFAGGRQGGLLLSEDNRVSIMLCEEDHLRLQVMNAGLDLDGCYRKADEMDTALSQSLSYAFDKRLGYLTQCPTNLGTGMRASLMLHLPALEERGALSKLAATVSKLGLTIRGMYGEGSRSEGSLYQLSNQVSLGISEQAAIENLKNIAMQIIREERQLREKTAQDPATADIVWRSLGLLRSARLLSHAECMKLLSNVRLGAVLGMLDGVSADMLNTLMIRVQPATIMAEHRRAMKVEERDALRAEMVREQLA